MTIQKTQRLLLKIGIGLLVIQIPWFVAIQVIVNKTQTKTTATVIRIGHAAANCTGDRFGYDRSCDHSDRLYPIYEYYDQHGTPYIKDDQYLDAFKQNNPLGKIFGKKVGDKVTAYYTNGKPQEITFMGSLVSYSAWLIPLFIATPLLIIDAVLYTKIRFGKKQ